MNNRNWGFSTDSDSFKLYSPIYEIYYISVISTILFLFRFQFFMAFYIDILVCLFSISTVHSFIYYKAKLAQTANNWIAALPVQYIFIDKTLDGTVPNDPSPRPLLTIFWLFCGVLSFLRK